MKKIALILLLFFWVGCCTTAQSQPQAPVSNTPHNPGVVTAKAQTCPANPVPPAPVGKISQNLGFVGQNMGNSCTINLYVVGRGAPPTDSDFSEIQKYLLSERAAIADGYRLFSEKLQGIFVEAYTKAGYYKIDYDRINLATRAFLKGVEIVSIKHKGNGVCEAEMKITIQREQLCCYVPQVVANYVNTCNSIKN